MHGPWQRLMWYSRHGRWSARDAVLDVDRAGPEREQPADHVHRLVDARRRRVRPEVAAAVVDQLARPLDAREVVAEGDLDVRVALVVLEPDVEARPVALDQVGLEEQRLRDRIGLGDLDVGDAVDDAPDAVDLAGRAPASASTSRTRLRRLCALPTYSDVAAGVLHEVDAGLVGQLGEGGREFGGHPPMLGQGHRPQSTSPDPAMPASPSVSSSPVRAGRRVRTTSDVRPPIAAASETIGTR